MKYLLVLVVVVFMGWILLGRKGGRGPSDAAAHDAKPGGRKGKSADMPLMVHCAHCGVHLPDTESVVNADGQRFCNEAHRLAGPR